jgi:hypothetical protein
MPIYSSQSTSIRMSLTSYFHLRKLESQGKNFSIKLEYIVREISRNYIKCCKVYISLLQRISCKQYLKSIGIVITRLTVEY